jgi:hypothetical protein
MAACADGDKSTPTTISFIFNPGVGVYFQDCFLRAVGL